MVKRYDFEDFIGDDVNRIEREFGEYITYEDHEDALLDAKYDYDQLQKKYDKLVNKLGALYQEA